MSERAVERVLVVTAHPDDVDFGAAGTVATWTDAGVAVAYCIVTNGDAGGFDAAVPRSSIPAIRQAEQRAAAKEVGVDDLVFLGYPDGYLEVSMKLRTDIAREIRRHRPDVVVCQNPTRNPTSIFASHPDHLAAGEATVCAVYPDARNPFWMPELIAEGFEPHAAWQVWMMASETPNRYVDISAHIDRKLAALKRHESQMSDVPGMEARVRMWNSANATAGGLPEGSYAESFLIIETP